MNTAAPTLTKQSEIMIDTRYSQLKQMLEDHRRRLQRSLRVRLRDVRANNGHDGNVVEAVDAAEASDSDLQQDFGIANKRLTALPFALRCRECEEIKEIGERSRRFSSERNDSLLRYNVDPQYVGAGERE